MLPGGTGCLASFQEGVGRGALQLSGGWPQQAKETQGSPPLHLLLPLLSLPWLTAILSQMHGPRASGGLMLPTPNSELDVGLSGRSHHLLVGLTFCEMTVTGTLGSFDG